MSEPIRTVVIVGGGLAGWYSAARLCHAMRGRSLQVRVVRAAPAAAVVDPLDVFCASTLSTTPVAHAELGIDERSFLRDCDATFKLATEIRGFDQPSHGYLLPFGEIGARLEAVGFHQFVSRLMRAGRELSLDDYSVPAIAARLGRFAHPTRDARSVLSTYEYGYHLDTTAYTGLMRGIAERLGAVAVEQDLAEVDVAAHDQVRSLTLGDGSRVTADLYLDCTGARAALLQALRVPFESWRDWLPCDTARLSRLPAPAELPPATRATALPGGWTWQVPLRSALETALVFDSRTPPDPSTTAGGPARDVSFRNGMHRDAWRGNCVAIGAAAGFVEPLAGTGLRLLDAGVTQLVALFPDQDDLRLMATEYNRILGSHYDSVRDFVLLHYLLSRRGDGPLWQARTTPPPPTLQRCLETFRYRGRVGLHEDEVFEEAWWACAFLGLGVRPSHFSILAEQGSEADLLAQVTRITQLMRAAVERLPAHRAYLSSYLGGAS